MTILLIAGSRTVYPPPEVIDAADDGLLFVLSEVTEVVSAPKMRNREMARYLDTPSASSLAIILWDGLSGGAADMAIRLMARGIPTRVIPVDPRVHPAPGRAPDADWGSPEWMRRQGARRKR